MFNARKAEGDGEELLESMKSRNPMVSEEKPRSDEFMSMMALMQIEYTKMNRERNNWLIEKTKMETRTQVLEGKLRTLSSVNNELISRIRLLEISLLESRNQKRENMETVAPPHNYDIDKLLERRARVGGSYKRGRHLLNQYIREVMSVEENIKKTGNARNIVKSLFERYRGKAYSEIFDISLPANPAPALQKNTVTDDVSEGNLPSKKPFSGDGCKSNDGEFSLASGGRIVPRSESRLRSKANDIDSLFGFLSVEDESTKQESERDVLDSEELNREIVQAMNEVDVLTKELDNEEKSTSTDDVSIGSLESIDVGVCEADDVPLSTSASNENGKRWKPRYTLKGHLDVLYSVKFNPRHEILASTSEDGVVCLYDVKNMDDVVHLPMTYLRGHKYPAISCTFDQDGLYLYSADKNGEIIVWDPAGEAEILERYETNGQPIWELSHSKNSRMLLSGSADGVCRFWKPDVSGPVSSVNFDGTNLVSATYYPLDHSKILVTTNNTVWFYDVIGEAIIHKISYDGNIRSVAANPKKPILATGWEEKNIRILDTRQLKYVQNIVAHPNPVSALSYDSSGDSLVSGSTNGAINIWSSTYECIESIQSHRTKAYGGVVCLDHHHVHPYLASGGADDVAKIYVYS